MTSASIQSYLQTEAKMAGLPDDVQEQRGKDACQMGISNLWYSWRWSCRVKAGTLVALGDDETINFPGDFRSMKSIREINSSQGTKLSFMDKEEFDEYVPKLSNAQTSNPMVFTVYKDREDDVYKFQSFPRPIAQSIPFLYYTTAPSDAADVPEELLAALIACCRKFVYKPGTREFAGARLDAANEIALAKTVDKVSFEKTFKLAPSGNISRLKGLAWTDTWLNSTS